MKRGLAIALFVSIAANIFLGGFVAGRVLAGPGGFLGNSGGPGPERAMHGPRAGGGPFMGSALMFPALEALPPEKRELFRESFEESRRALFANRRSLLEKRKAFHNALTAEPWDRAATQAALSDLKSASDSQEAVLVALLMDVFEKLTPEERKALVTASNERERAWKKEERSGRFRDGRRERPGRPGPDGERRPPAPPSAGDEPLESDAEEQAPLTPPEE